MRSVTPASKDRSPGTPLMRMKWGIQGGFVGGPSCRNSVAGFASATDGQNYDLLSVVAVEGDVGALAKFDNPLAELGREVFDWATDLGMLAENLHALADRFDGTAGRVRALRGEKGMEAAHIEQRRWEPGQM